MMAKYEAVYYGDRPNESMGGYEFNYQDFIPKFSIKASTSESKRSNSLTEDQAGYTAIVLADLIERGSLVITPKVPQETIDRVQGLIDQFTLQESQRLMSSESKDIKDLEEKLSAKIDAVLQAVTDMRAAFTPAKAETTAATKQTGLPKA